METVPQQLRYTKDHEWAKLDGETVVVGITHYAQDSLGEVVFIDLQKAPGDTIDQHATFGVVESIKAVSDMYAPIAGTILEVNTALSSDPGQLNRAPYDHWLIKVKPSNPSQLEALLTPDQYRQHTGG